MDREGVGSEEGIGKLREVIQGRGGVVVRPGKSRRAWAHSFISSLCAGFLSGSTLDMGVLLSFWVIFSFVGLLELCSLARGLL